MKKLGFVRGLVVAGAFSLAGMLLSQAASATTINAGQSANLTFDLYSTSTYNSLRIDFGGFTSGSLSFDLTGGSFSGTTSTTLSGSSGGHTILDVTGPAGSPVSVLVHYTASPGKVYDLSSLSMTAYADTGGQGSAVSNTVPDAVSITPIPASLPLLLAGAGLLYGFTCRRKKSKRVSV